MVKNLTGGKGSKNLARKDFDGNFAGGHRVYSTDPDEIYAFVVKALGNCMFYVNTISHGQLILHVRGKFSGKNKRNNLIQVGSFILAGLRNFENPHKNCDLLHIYSNNDVLYFQSFNNLIVQNFFLQNNNKNHHTENDNDNDIIFSTTQNNDEHNEIKMIDEQTDDDYNNHDDEINIDDI